MSRKRANKKGCENNQQIVLTTAIIQLLTVTIDLIKTLLK